VGLLTEQIADLFSRARRYYAEARACENAECRRRFFLVAEDYFRQAKELQRKQVRRPGISINAPE